MVSNFLLPKSNVMLFWSANTFMDTYAFDPKALRAMATLAVNCLAPYMLTALI